jgi:hypothetical protein
MNTMATSTTTTIRSEMVNAAKQFMTNPRVKQTTLAEQKEFLKGKGLTEDEIETAVKEIHGHDQQNQQVIKI